MYEGAPRASSFLVPGMSSRRMTLRFPRSGVGLDQAAPDYYSEIRLKDGRAVRYQLQFPDEAFQPVARKASATVQSALDSGSAIDRPLGQGKHLPVEPKDIGSGQF